MGNRAVITLDPKLAPDSLGIYLHWSGSPEQIAAFLDTCKGRGYRSPACDPSYALARLTQVCCEAHPDGLSVGIGKLSELDCDNWDNGTYVIGGHWEITGRAYDPETKRAEEQAKQRAAAVAAIATARKSSAAALGSVDVRTLRKGDRVKLRNGWYATVADNNGRGLTRICTVEGFETETGSVYAHDIAYKISGESLQPVTHTPSQLKLRARCAAMGM